MKWRWLAIYAAIVAVLFAALIVVRLFVPGGGSGEPSWRGKKLTEWMYGHLRTNPGEFFDAEGVAAIRAVGTNGLPTFVKMLGTKEDSTAELMFLGWFHGRIAIEKRILATQAILILGTNAFSCIPDIVRLTRHKEAEVRRESLDCLYMMRPDKAVLLPVLAEHLKDADPGVQEAAARHIARRYPEDSERLGIYDSYPDLKRAVTNSVSTNTPAGK